MTSDKKNISLLADIFIKSGLTNIVISPGSRNAPIILSFANRHEINAFSIVDERSAAFFALGIALQTGKTAAVACTSGSAALNYSSAISEAYYQKIPMLILTADRPSHFIDVGDGQTIRQENVYRNFIKKSYQLPQDLDTKEKIELAERTINEALTLCCFPQPGPIHINLPFGEPLYNTTKESVLGRIIQFDNTSLTISDTELKKIAKKWNTSKKVMIIAGQTSPNYKVNSILEKISQNKNTVVLTETTSNLIGENFIDTIDNVVSTIDKSETELFKPEILITFGGQVVSKMVKKFLRTNKPREHWHISPSGEKMDTYFSLTKVLISDEFAFLDSIYKYLSPFNSNYPDRWHGRKKEVDIRKNDFLAKAGYSDLKVFEIILKQLPASSVLHLGNSTPVRYSQLFGSRKDIVYNSNRGVSGIDGQVSTAAGYTYYSDKLNVLITGDLGFFYDSNGLMNKYLVPNLKIIVINNSGGGIFRFIPGPDTTPNMEEFFEAKHNWKAEYICKAFYVVYKKAENIEELQRLLPKILSTKNQYPEVLEIFTPSDKNAEILREYFQFIRK
ncbi:MAG: 2-succinyl-5-enolpyruvyl-6-hydroxy-3-cyclohexene-1-carboxylic-acid synthase [Bacteroidetes bacterium]|nr:2-succinyl-5-enolpyruvyl-6-hydroxy-3-cyclohexene-1-carboxylic-acid synthase [Bacteroidota bacterium]MBL6944265.1 2-succinyl-5-enolpyruvyl-6-hydroxy-3-cyclohexene-1-carboxylic-acid synthase [Bacteroidales bacterium]